MRISMLAATAVLASACATAPSTGPSVATSAPDTALPAPAPSAPNAERMPASAWTTSNAALAMLKEEEALRTTAYQLSGQWLIGYGHSRDVQAGMTITRKQAETFLRADVKACEGVVARSVSVPVTRNEFSALVALCFNIGEAHLQESSVVTKLNAGDRTGAADAFLLWDKDEGERSENLQARRKRERALFVEI